MHAHVPILSNKLIEIERFIISNEIGVVISDLSPKAISSAIMNLKQDHKLRAVFRENCKKTALKVNWNKESERLIKAIKSKT